MKTLHLTLHRKWFAAIHAGTKTEEYRKRSPYWIRRLKTGKSSGHFDRIRFRNGYRAEAPTMIVECKGIRDDEANRQFIISLGPILETKNWPPADCASVRSGP